jgi:hypothetical protein
VVRASQRAAPVDARADPARDAHPRRSVGGAAVTIAPSTLRHVADPLAAALDGYRDALLRAAPIDAHAEIRERCDAARVLLCDAAHAAGLPRSGGAT